MPKPYLCKICSATDPELFYKRTTKSTCKKCILDNNRAKRAIKNVEKTDKLKGHIDKVKPYYDSRLENLHNTLKQYIDDRIDCLDDQEQFDRADGSMTFREYIIEHLYVHKKVIGGLVETQKTQADEIAKMKDRITYLENQVGRDDEIINEKDDRISELENRIRRGCNCQPNGRYMVKSSVDVVKVPLIRWNR